MLKRKLAQNFFSSQLHKRLADTLLPKPGRRHEIIVNEDEKVKAADVSDRPVGSQFELMRRSHAGSPTAFEGPSSTDPSFPPSPLPTIELLGFRVANATQTEALDWLFARLTCAARTRVHYLNAHCSNVATFDANYRKVLSKADLIVPDGSGIWISARLQGKHLAANLNLTDLIPLACQRLAEIGGSVFLLGGKAGVAEAAAENLIRAYPRLRIAGTHHGFFGEGQDDEVVQQINKSGAQMLLVAMSVPRQEIWLDRMMPLLNPSLIFAVGGLLDFLSGRVPRAPILIRSVGMEWAYRLYQEPRRMWCRYLLGNPLFLVRSLGPSARIQLARARRLFGATGTRVLDVCIASAGLALLSLPMLLVAAAIRLTSLGPVIFRQRRVGKYGRLFTIYKFRTMHQNALMRLPEIAEMNHHGIGSVSFKVVRDPRVTPIGRWLRKSSIDELPQLWNVLRGDMSLVGPRPPFRRRFCATRRNSDGAFGRVQV